MEQIAKETKVELAAAKRAEAMSKGKSSKSGMGQRRNIQICLEDNAKAKARIAKFGVGGGGAGGQRGGGGDGRSEGEREEGKDEEEESGGEKAETSRLLKQIVEMS